jgi:hypothetical protein
MSDRIFSLSKAIRETLSDGIPTSSRERNEHYTLAREAEENQFRNAYHFGNTRDRALYVPLETFAGSTRDLATTPASAGRRIDRVDHCR